MNNPILQKIEEESKYEKLDYANYCFLRACFNSESKEWDKSSLAQKVEALEVLVNKDMFFTSTLVVKILRYYNEKENKGIEQRDIAISLSKIIDFILRAPSSRIG